MIYCMIYVVWMVLVIFVVIKLPQKPLEKWNSFTELQIKFLNVDALRTCSDSSKNHSSDMKDV